MTFKLNRYLSGIMEAAWLAAVSLIPIFFNIYSSRIFEPDKAAILRSLALLSLGAWLLKIVNEGRSKWANNQENSSLIIYLLKFPMIAPILGLVIVYIISTIFSVTPLISLLGSYQRLQGTYTTFSYLVIFISIISNLRTREQVNRLITTIIFASLPVSLYGLLQRYQIDPIPWGGNVSTRIAGNMGNSIFIAAYLIMVFPLTASRMVESFIDILKNDEATISRVIVTRQVIKATIYVFILALELIAIYMSGSRGPMLGLFAGSYLFILLLSIYWKKRGLTYLIISIALLGMVFLAVFNLNNGPLEALKKSPAIGRFGLLLDPESNSALVRQYIWEGTVDLTGIHDPLKFPDGSTDKFNLLRPLIGYGPESMYVAYNQFYQPDLGRVEKRNASPDRSHNETWDSIVITGVAGLTVYLLIFGSIFYYGLQWLGLINNQRQKIYFISCLVGGGLIGAIALVILRGIEFLGIGLPIGMIVGVVIYLTLFAVLSRKISTPTDNHRYSLLLVALFAAIIGHFLEINFGIAIVSTRTLFWVYAGLMIVIGYVIPKVELSQEMAKNEKESGVNTSPYERKKKRDGQSIRSKKEQNNRPIIGDQPEWVRNSLVNAFIVGIILVTLGFDYITNSNHNTSVVKIFLDAFTRLPNKNNAFSLGIFVLTGMSWIIGSLIYYVDGAESALKNQDNKVVGINAAFSLGIGILFWLLHAISLAVLARFTPETQNDVIVQVNSIGALLTKYYIYIFVFIVLAAFLLPNSWPQRSTSKNTISILISPLVLLLIFVLVNLTNLKVVHADITFKMADPFTKSGQWQVATFLYKRSLEFAPKEDHYYLFLGRSYLEQAKNTDAAQDQDKLVLQAETDLKTAQSINPLNTDHTANLARLFSWWASAATTQSEILERGDQASAFYSTAVTLSPNNSTIWDEWAVLFMQVLNQPKDALERLQHALSLDDHYSFTQGLFGDYYLRIANATQDTDTRINALKTAANYYKNAVDVAKSTDATTKATYLVSLGNVYMVLDSINQNDNHVQLKIDVETLVKSSETGIKTNEAWKVQEVIAKVYKQLGEKYLARKYANLALLAAPDSVITRIQDLTNQIDALP